MIIYNAFGRCIFLPKIQATFVAICSLFKNTVRLLSGVILTIVLSEKVDTYTFPNLSVVIPVGERTFSYTQDINQIMKN